MTRLHSNHSQGHRVTENLLALSFKKLQGNFGTAEISFNQLVEQPAMYSSLLPLPSCRPGSDFLTNAEIQYVCNLQLPQLIAHWQRLRYVKGY